MDTDDVVALERLRGAFADAAMRREHDRFAALFTDDGVWEVPDMGVRFEGRAAVRAGIEHMLGLWEFFVQTVHPGVVELDGDTATGRSYVNEVGRFRDGTSQLNHAVYDDRFARTPQGWRFAERSYHFLYVDTTPLPGTATARATDPTST